jgi:parallel beta-helix repeat protein
MRAHIFLLMAVMVLPLTTVGASTVTYSEELYGTIQGAVDAASPGDTLILPEGFYEGPIIVDKPLTIIGAGEKTSLFVYDEMSIMTIKSDSVSVNQVQFLFCNTAILVEETSSVSVENCFFVENAVGVDIRGGADHVIKGSHFINNVACGAILQGVQESSIEGNYFNFSQPDDQPDIQSLLGNSPGLSRIGLKLLGSSNLTVTGNTFHNIDRCMYMGNSLDCVIADNSFHNSTVGLSMRDSTYNILEDNKGYETEELLFLWLSSYNNITGNANQGGALSRDVDSSNLYLLRGVNVTGRNFILEASEPSLDPIFEPLSDALNVTLLPDPVTESAWAMIGVNSTELHGDAVTGSVGLYDPFGRMITGAEVVNQRTVLDYSVQGGVELVLAKKVDSVAPVAVAGSDATGMVDEAVSFDASASTDDLGIAEYRWSFGDGVESVGVRVAHQYGERGVYTARLVVVDAAGNTGEDSVQVTIIDEEAEKTGGDGMWPALVALLIVLSAGAYMIYRRR